MTTADLLELPRVLVSDAAKYLQSGMTAEDIRVRARAGSCPFCIADKRTPKSRVYRYRVNVGALIKANWPDGNPLDLEVRP